MREKIRLMSSAKTGHYYTTTKNKRLHPEKMETKKYDPTIRKHVSYKETKIKQQLLKLYMPELPEVETAKRGLEPSLVNQVFDDIFICLLYTSPSPRDKRQSRMPSSA